MLQSDLSPTLLGQEAPVVSPRVSPRHLHLDGDGGAGGGRGDLPRASLSGPGDHLGWNVVQLSSGSEISRVTPVTGLLAGKGIYFHIGHVI